LNFDLDLISYFINQTFLAMNKITLLLGLFFIVSLSLNTYGQTGQALDNENGTSMLPITNELDAIVKALEKEKVEIVRVEFDLLFDSKVSYRTLSQGYTYGIFAWGDYRIKALVVRIYKKVDGEWKYYADGDESGNTSSVKFQTAATEEYKFEIKVLQFAEGYKAGHYGLVVFHN
jgi:hypothetical protein